MKWVAVWLTGQWPYLVYLLFCLLVSVVGTAKALDGFQFYAPSSLLLLSLSSPSQIPAPPFLYLCLSASVPNISMFVCVVSLSRPWRWVGGQLMPARGPWLIAEWWTDSMSSGWATIHIDSQWHRLQTYIIYLFFSGLNYFFVESNLQHFLESVLAFKSVELHTL